MPELCRGTQLCGLQLGVGTGSAPSIPTFALKRCTHLPVMNDTPLTTGADNVVATASVATAVSVGGVVRDGAADAAGNMTATLPDSQMGDTQTSDAASPATGTATYRPEGWC